jgi:NitT/TauT family transport system substrate-binding protein
MNRRVAGSRLSPLAVGVALLAGGCGDRTDPATGALRVGHFANVTHAQGLVAHGRSRAGRGWFEERVGAPVRWYVFHAGPSAMEALLAGSLDVTYVGPNPAIAAHLASGGQDVRVVAGSAFGGSALVGRLDGPAEPAGFRGKRIATPQLGNTQDVSARAWLAAAGLSVSGPDPDVRVRPVANPEALVLFRRGDVDGVWTVEPWVSALVLEAGGRVVVEEPDALTTVVVARREVLEKRRDVVRRFVAAHEALTRWVAENPEEARREVAEEIRAETGAAMSPAVLEQAFRRLRFRASVERAPFDAFLARARGAGLVEGAGTLERLVDLPGAP